MSEKYNILPSSGLLLFPEDVEKDDYLHNPDPNDKDRDCEIFTRRGVVNLGGLALIGVGVLALFIAFPVTYDLPRLLVNLVLISLRSTFVQKFKTNDDPCLSVANCIPGVSNVPLLKNMRTGMIDPDTPDSAKTKTAVDGSTLNLVVSFAATT